MSNIAIVETNKLHLEGIFGNYEIYAYSVDSTLSAIEYDTEVPPYTTETMTMEDFSVLEQTPTWNHDLIQDGE